jgi:hypothetical protein
MAHYSANILSRRDKEKTKSIQTIMLHKHKISVEILLRRRCKILVAPGFIPGITNTQNKKVRPQKLQKAPMLHAPQNGVAKLKRFTG